MDKEGGNMDNNQEKKDLLKDFVDQHREAFDHRMPDSGIRARIIGQFAGGKLGGGKLEEGENDEKLHSMPSSHVTRSTFRFRWSVAASVALLILCGSMATYWFWPDGSKVKPEQVQLFSQQSHVDEGRESATVVPPVEDGTDSTTAVPSAVPVAPMQWAKTEQGPADQRKSADPKEEEKQLLALIEMEESASTRLDGLLQMATLKDWSPTLFDKLKNTVNHDPNSNVRSAALGLLMERLPPEEHLQTIQEVFVYQDDPSIQLDIMMYMASQDEGQINATTANRLWEIAENPFAFDFVKEQAYAVLLKNW